MNVIYIVITSISLSSLIILLQFQNYYMSLSRIQLYQLEKNFYKYEKGVLYGIAYYKQNYQNFFNKTGNTITINKFQQAIHFIWLTDLQILIKTDNCSCVLTKMENFNGNLKFLVSDWKVFLYTK